MKNLKYICSECNSKNITTNLEDYKFPYGVEPETVMLSCEIPVHKCNECSYCFTDKEAEHLRHEAVCKHLNLMTPKQIKALRKLFDFTQARFSEITNLGEATLSRWERGIVIQNSAYDNYLYLLGFKENVDRLLNKNVSLLPASGQEQKTVFKKLKVTDELLKKQNEFELCPCLVSGE